jgi:hypothetical protein
MAFRLARMIAKIGWNTLALRLSQYGLTGSAAFYLETEPGVPPKPDEVSEAFATTGTRL